MRKLHLQLRFALSAFFFLVLTAFALGQAQQAVIHGYQRAPKPIPEILDAHPTPTALASPKGDRLLVVDRLANPPVSDLAQPMLRLAGIRIILPAMAVTMRREWPACIASMLPWSSSRS